MDQGLYLHIRFISIVADKCQEILVRILVFFFQECLQHISLQHAQLRLICNSERRVQIQILEMIPDDVQTKRINRTNSCAVCFHQLPPQMFIQSSVIRRICNGFPDAGMDLLFHAGCGCPGERHDDQIINGNAVLDDLFQHALYQDRGLSGPGRCGDKDI